MVFWPCRGATCITEYPAYRVVPLQLYLTEVGSTVSSVRGPREQLAESRLPQDGRTITQDPICHLSFVSIDSVYDKHKDHLFPSALNCHGLRCWWSIPTLLLPNFARHKQPTFGRLCASVNHQLLGPSCFGQDQRSRNVDLVLASIIGV